MEYGNRSMVRVWLPTETQQLATYAAEKLKTGKGVLYTQAIEFAIRSPVFLDWLKILYLEPQDPKQQTLEDAVVEPDLWGSNG